MRIALSETAKVFSGSLLIVLFLATPGCLTRRVTHVNTPSPAIPAREASLAELVAKVDAWGEPIHTMTATVDLEPTAGSVYSGVIKEYHDVKGFVLLEKPSTIRIQGQAPVVRTNIFDMVSKGEEFRLYVPSKQKFIVGKTTFQRPVKNALENLRPQHILQALLIPPIDADHETAYRKKVDHRREGKRYYVVTVLEPENNQRVNLRREMWFDRADLELVRAQFYDPDGTCTEDVRYSQYQDFQGIHYPTHIEVNRPEDDYELTITIEKATFNEPISPEKFDLEMPAGAELIDLRVTNPEEHPHGQ